MRTMLLALAVLVFAAAAPGQRGAGELPGSIGAGFGDLLVRSLAAEDGVTRVALSSPTGAPGPLVRSRPGGAEVVLETLTLFGARGVGASVALDGRAAQQADRSNAFGATRFSFDQPLSFDSNGHAGRFEVHGPGFQSGSSPSGELPPYTAVVRIGSAVASGLRQFTGFETGDLEEFSKVVGSVSVQNSTVRSGAFAMRSFANAGEYAYATMFDVKSSGFSSTSLGIDELYLSFQFRVADWDQRVRFAEVGGESGATKCRVELEPDGRISLEDDGLTRRFGQQVLATDQWYRIDLIVGTGTSTRLQLKIDGQVEIDVNDANTSNELTRRVHVGRAASSGGPSDFYYDDVVLSDQSHAGDARVVLLAPDGPGAASQWVGSCSDLDDWPHDGDASHAVSNGPGAITCALEPSTGISGQVLGVKALAVQRREGSSFTGSALRLRSAGLDFDTSSGDAGSSYRLRSRVFADDPATGSAWQVQALADLEVGLVQLQSQASLATRVTAVGAQVLFAPGSGGGSSDVRQFTGFETGDLSEFSKSVGGASVQGAVVRSGAFAMRSRASSGEYAYATLFDVPASGFGSTSFGIDDLYLSFQLRVDDSNQRIRFAEVSGEGGSTKLRVEFESDRRVSVKDASSTRYYGQQVLAMGQWYRIGLRVGTGTSTDVQLLVDGQVEIDVTAADTSSAPTRRVHIGRSSKSGGPSDFYFDDVIVSDQSHPADARVLLLEPDGSGAFSGWLGDWFDLDDWPHDGDATFAVSNGPGTITCELDPAAGVSGQVLGVKALAVQRREGNSFTQSALRLRSGGLDFDSAPGDGGENWRLRSRLFAEDPATGSAWQISSLGTLEVGLRQLQAQPSLATRATAVGAAILYAP